jgi:hypothetical protein
MVLSISPNALTYKISEEIVINYTMKIVKNPSYASQKDVEPLAGLLIMEPYFALDYHMQCNDMEITINDTAGNVITPLHIEGDYEINPGLGFIPNRYLPEKMNKMLPEHNEFWPKPMWLWDTTPIAKKIILRFGKTSGRNIDHLYVLDKGSHNSFNKDTLPPGKYKLLVKYFVSDSMHSCWPQYYTDNYGKPLLNVWKGEISSNQIEIRITK